MQNHTPIYKPTENQIQNSEMRGSYYRFPVPSEPVKKKTKKLQVLPQSSMNVHIGKNKAFILP